MLGVLTFMALSPQDKRDMDKFLKFLCLKSTQIIVQGRLGKTIKTKSVPTPSGAEWFNLAIKDYPEIHREAKASMANGLPGNGKSLVIEISLRTSDADTLVLEVWSIGVTSKCDDVRIHHTVYNRMSMLLRSLLCVSRVTPAYKLSRNQGNEYVICYRVYMGQISLNGLGEGFKTLRVGSVASPVGTLTMSAAYRTIENLHVSTKGISPQLSGNHSLSAARPCHTLTSRLRTLSETSDTNPLGGKGSSSPSYNIFNASQSTSPQTAKDGDKIMNAKAMFTVGTPPNLLGSNTHERFQQRSHSASFQRSPQNQFYRKGSSPVKIASSAIENSGGHIRHGFSAPVLDAGNFTQIRRQKRSESNQQTDVVAHSPSNIGDTVATTFCHWNNSNVTKVKADSVLLPNSPKHCVPVTKPNKSAKVVMGWKDSSNTNKQTTNCASSPPFPVSGAFVTGSKTASKAQATLAAAEAVVLPFTDLVNMSNTSDDNLSQKSDSDNGLELNEKSLMDKRSHPRSDSSGSLTSKQSGESSGGTPEHYKKQGNDDFVMVDLNPAFGRDDSVGDLGNFYRECENVPELIMFEEQKGTETEETLLDLAQELEDYTQDMKEFDEFITELHT